MVGLAILLFFNTDCARLRRKRDTYECRLRVAIKSSQTQELSQKMESAQDILALNTAATHGGPT